MKWFNFPGIVGLDKLKVSEGGVIVSSGLARVDRCRNSGTGCIPSKNP
jgi:hypothetical protein